MKILYAEDERQLSMAIAEILRLEHYEVDAVYDGAQALAHLRSGCYDAAILDIMMPEMDGVRVVEQMRLEKNYTPVLRLTANNTTEDRGEGLSGGADDYLSKPFAAKELLARLNSLLRRNAEYQNSVLICGNISLDCGANELCSPQGSLRLSSRESELLSLLIRHHGQPVPAQAVAELLQTESAAALYFSYLKNKLEQLHADVKILTGPEGCRLERVEAP
ncbi:MAG: response regulator [Oscillospiraceae bacterium]|nr:response regulator [Oscillospiraceae bacterium]